MMLPKQIMLPMLSFSPPSSTPLFLFMSLFWFMYVIQLHERLFLYFHFYGRSLFHNETKLNNLKCKGETQRDREKRHRIIYIIVCLKMLLNFQSILIFDLLYGSNYFHLLEFVACYYTK